MGLIEPGLALGDEVVAHYYDQSRGSMPSTATGGLTAEGGMLVVGGTPIDPSDVVSLHSGECRHDGDRRSPAARRNFERKYER